jgi:uncharacterized protein YjeT (DUF2065 family)
MHLDQVLAGAAVVLALEGLAYAIFPEAMRRTIAAVAQVPQGRLRAGGLVAATAGIGLAWWLTR